MGNGLPRLELTIVLYLLTYQKICFLEWNITYVSILLCSSPSLTSGSQWQKQLAIKTPPPRFRRKERETFFSFFFSLFITSGSMVSMLEKSYLKNKGLSIVDTVLLKILLSSQNEWQEPKAETEKNNQSSCQHLLYHQLHTGGLKRKLGWSKLSD